MMMTTDADRVRALLGDSDRFADQTPAADVVERNRAVVMARLDHPPARQPGWRLSPLRQAIIGAATVTAVVAALAIAPTANTGEGSLTPLVYRSQSQGDELLAIAARQAGAAAPAGPVGYWRTEGWYLHGGPESASQIVPELREHWLSDTSYAYRASSGEPLPVDELGEERLIGPADGDLQEQPIDQHVERARQLPGDETAVLNFLRGNVPADPEVAPDTEAFILAGDLLATHAAPPGAQRALLTALPRLEGVRVLGVTEDRAGRTALSLGMTSTYGGATTRYELLIDPATGQILGREQTLLSDLPNMDVDAPAVISYELHTDTSSAPELGQRP